MTDHVSRLLADDYYSDQGPYVLADGPVREVTHRLREVVAELDGFAATDDTAAYALVIHALARDLLSATGARGSAWNHPAHLAFVDRVNARWSTPSAGSTA